MVVGNNDNADVRGLSGGWSQSFKLTTPQRATLSFRYMLTQASDYEDDEYSEALAMLDGSLIGGQ